MQCKYPATNVLLKSSCDSTYTLWTRRETNKARTRFDSKLLEKMPADTKLKNIEKRERKWCVHYARAAQMLNDVATSANNIIENLFDIEQN